MFLLCAPLSVSVEEKTENQDKNCQKIPLRYASIKCKKERVMTVIEITYHTPDQAEGNVIVKPPKNIRQIGSPRGRHKIYIEDYVHTYLHSSLLFRDQKQRAAILLGRSEVSQDIRYTFIEGAVNCEDFIFQQDGIVFDESCWQYIYQEMKEYFDQMIIVGWFLGRPGFPLKISHTVEAAQRKYFSGRDKVLYLWDPEEGEDLFYAYEQGSFQKKEGYYVYYEKNLSMQEYMVCQRERNREEQGGIQELTEGFPKEEGKREPEGEQAEQASQKAPQTESMEAWSMEEAPEGKKRETDTAIGNYRSMLRERGRKEAADRKNMFLYGAATAVLVAVCISGVVHLNSYQKMKEMEEVLSMVSKPLEEQQKEQSKGQVTVRNMPGMVNAQEDAAPEGSSPAPDQGQADASGQQGSSAEGSGQPGDGDASGQPGSSEGGADQGQADASGQPGSSEGGADQGQADASGQPGSSQGGADQGQADASGQQGSSEGGSGQPGDQSQKDAASQEAMAYLEQGYYVVQPGDHLEDICRRIYPDRDMMEKLCEVNKIEDVDKIQAGQKLILP